MNMLRTVFVDAIVAESIQAVLTGKKTPRPLTHEPIHFKAPIFVNQDLLDSQGLDLDHPQSKPETRT